MLLSKAFFFTCLISNALCWNISDVKRGADQPDFDFRRNNLMKMLVQRRRHQKTLVLSQKIKNQDLRKALNKIQFEKPTKNIQKNLNQRRNKNSRFNSYKRFHTKRS